MSVVGRLQMKHTQPRVCLLVCLCADKDDDGNAGPSKRYIAARTHLLHIGDALRAWFLLYLPIRDQRSDFVLWEGVSNALDVSGLRFNLGEVRPTGTYMHRSAKTRAGCHGDRRAGGRPPLWCPLRMLLLCCGLNSAQTLVRLFE